ncbi:MAG: 4-hydroxythreonine-4-phosphate dehydrogenase PdxA [Gemmatimonadetes bacterium]|nr:4-hydroxythreonine-4-phosphate dehydrogenase PdxA [Gemmatimonadota bacterium]
MTKRRIGITLGDPRGIGPEVTEKALASPGLKRAEFVLIGPAGVTEAEPGVKVAEWVPGSGAAEAGRIAGEAIRKGVEMALAGEIDALVTAPIEKSAFRAGGSEYPGHTEMLQALTGAPAVGMMMTAERTALNGPLRVILATTHIALRDVPGAITLDLLVEQAMLATHALSSWWGIEQPRLAIAALNPHASDGGLFGDEEERVFIPALTRLRALGAIVQGPIPADTVFSRAIRGEFDAVIAPYHDVGMAAFKTVAFGGGVNVTLGLPFPRTSPDHGTALDIAGRKMADPGSMIEALNLAIELAHHFDRPSPRK